MMLIVIFENDAIKKWSAKHLERLLNGKAEREPVTVTVGRERRMNV